MDSEKPPGREAKAVYAVDLDGTLAQHDPSVEFDPNHIGEPVNAMRRRVRQWTRQGIEVVILTARASNQRNIKVVEQWLAQHGMAGLRVTNVKDPSMEKIFDDRAVQVEQNTGKLIKAATNPYKDSKQPVRSVHYSSKHHPELRPLSYEELIADRRNGRWEKDPEQAKSYVNERRQNEDRYREKLKNVGHEVPADQSFLYSTIPGKERFGGLGDVAHEFDIPEEELAHTLFDVVGLPDELLHPDGPQLGRKGYEDALARWEKHQDKLLDGDYMGMKIRPRIEVISPHGNQGYAKQAVKTGCESFQAAAGSLLDTSLSGTKRAALLATNTPTDNTDNLALPINPQWTGPAAIEQAVAGLDLDAIEKDARTVLARKLKSKRPQAVERLGFVEGLRAAGMTPKDLLVSRVPVIPPMFRPFSVTGSTFVPGDANELYRDLINLLGTHHELEQRLGEPFAGNNRLRLYDAVTAVYGHGEPVVPKTKERGVSGFLKQITGVSPKFCYAAATEILTHNGWKHFAQCTALDTVRTYNPETNTFQWELPEAWVDYEHKGQLVEVVTAAGSLLVTAGHTMWVRQDSIWFKLSAAELAFNHANRVYAITLSGGDQPLDAEVVTIDQARFVPYTGKVFCCSTRAGLVVVRHHGLVTVSGNSFMQRKLLSRDQDFTGRGTATLSPDLNLDEVGIPDEMAWKLYAPYVQRRLVRGGMSPEEALRHLTDRSGHASKQLDLEMGERPIMYSRAPAWHKFNTLGGWGRRTKGNSVEVNPLVGTGQNLDHDGDSGRFVVRIGKCLDGGLGLRPAGVPMIHPKTSIKLSEANIHISNFPRLDATRVELRPGVVEWDVPPGTMVYALDRVSGKHGWMSVTKLSEHSNLTLWRVGLRSGESFFPSADHSLVAYRNGKLDLVTPAEAEGLCLPKVRQFERVGAAVETAVATGEQGKSQRKVEFKLKLNRDLGLFFGLMIGDGCVNCQAMVYLYGSGPKRENRRRFEEIVRSSQLPYGGHVDETHFTTASLGGGSSERERSTVSDCAWFNRWLKSQIGDGALEKRIPDFCLNASETHRLGVLDGLLSTDGSVSLAKAGTPRQQLVVNYSTSSPDLAATMQTLLHSLGITSSVSPAKSPTSGRDAYLVNIGTPSLRRLVERTGFTVTHPDKQALLAEHLSKVSLAAASSQRGDLVPYPDHLDQDLKRVWWSKHQKMRGTKKDFGSLVAWKSKGLVGRSSMLELLVECRSQGIWSEALADYETLLQDRSLGWDQVVSALESPIKLTGWDLTVPGALTFALASGLIVQDTLNIHVVSTPDAVRDVKEKLMPSRMLHSLKERDSIVPVPKHEYLLGIHGAQTAPTTGSHQFPDRASALRAIKAGQVKLTDEIQIGPVAPVVPAP